MTDEEFRAAVAAGLARALAASDRPAEPTEDEFRALARIVARGNTRGRPREVGRPLNKPSRMPTKTGRFEYTTQDDECLPRSA